MSHLIIDGYNVIRQSPYFSSIEARNFEQGRQALIEALVLYHERSRHRITVVFDAWKTDKTWRDEQQLSGIQVVYTKGSETADDFIMRLTSARGEAPIVVSSDRQIINNAKHKGWMSLSAKEFTSTLEAVLFTDRPMDKDEGPEIKHRTSKKKGPSKRLPKQKRRAMAQLKRLSRF